MTIKMYQVLSFQAFYEAIKGKKLPSKIAYKLSLVINKVVEHTRFYNERLNMILEEYGERDSEGQLVYVNESSVKIKQDKIRECQIELNELQNLEVDLGDTNLTIDDLNDLDFTIEEITIIAPLLKS